MNCGDFSEAGQGGISPLSTKRPIAKAYAVASEATSSFNGMLLQCLLRDKARNDFQEQEALQIQS